MNYSEINRTWVISLRDSKRRAEAFFQMHDNRIDFDWYDAIKMENGAEGLKKTFKSIFENSLYYGHENVLIFEDDVMFLHDNAKDMIERTIGDLRKDYHMCKFGANLLLPVERVTGNLNRIKASYALHAVLYSSEAMKIILENIKETDPIDVITLKHLEPLGKSYVSSDMIATQRPYPSDIFKFDPEKNFGNTLDGIYNKETNVMNWDVLMQQQWERNTKHIK